MKSLARYVILIESRMLRAALWALAAMSLLAVLWGPAAALAQGAASNKIAADLREGMQSPGARHKHWLRELAGTRYVRALVVSSSSDPELADLRAHVQAVGGAVERLHSCG